jgi:hypothetical protein
VLARLDLRGLRRIVRLRRLNLREPARLTARKTDHAPCGMRQTRSPNDPRPTEREYHSHPAPRASRPARRLARIFWCDGCDKLAPNPRPNTVASGFEACLQLRLPPAHLQEQRADEDEDALRGCAPCFNGGATAG